jgi:hypothetical protein
MTHTQTVQVQTRTQGLVPQEMMELARSKVSSALGPAGGPVLFARVTLAMAADPAVERPATARAVLDIGGRVVHVRAAGQTMRDAIGQMADRLRSRLDRVARNRERWRGHMPSGRRLKPAGRICRARARGRRG